MSIRNRHIAYIILFLLGAAFLFSCNAPEASHPADSRDATAPAKDTGIHKKFDRGPVSVFLDTDKSALTIAERLNLTISVIFDEDYDVELPKFGEKLEQFGIVDYQTLPPTLTDDKRSKISRAYVLEPFLSGDYTIPPMSVHFRKKNTDDDTDHEIQTEAITVKVTSLLPKNLEKMTLHDILPPENIPQSFNYWAWGGAAALLLLFSGIVAFIVIRKRKQHDTQKLKIKIPAHQQAFDELSALVAENLVEQGHVKTFYHKISDILRRYIENRFHIRAPELTTEEFLISIHARNEFDSSHKALLKNFLTHCDLVKFARHQPQTEDIQKTFDSCKEFIVGTQEKD